VLERRFGDLVWDGVVRGTGVAALFAIPLVLFRPAIGALVAFMLATVWVNGPLTPVLPAAYEPILMLYGRVYPPVLIGFLGALATVYVEFLNYRLYQRILYSDALQGARASNMVRRVDSLFARAPFFAVWLFSWTPLPYWVVRFLSPLARFPISRHLAATFLGRFPRLWFFAALGRWWRVDLRLLVLVGVVVTVVVLVLWQVRRASENARRGSWTGSDRTGLKRSCHGQLQRSV
jgi:hypothetical protein